MAESTVPSEVYEQAERAAREATGSTLFLAFESPMFRAGVESAYRAGEQAKAEDIACRLEAEANDEARRPTRDCCSHTIETWLHEAASIARARGAVADG